MAKFAQGVFRTSQKKILCTAYEPKTYALNHTNLKTLKLRRKNTPYSATFKSSDSKLIPHTNAHFILNTHPYLIERKFHQTSQQITNKRNNNSWIYYLQVTTPDDKADENTHKPESNPKTQLSSMKKNYHWQLAKPSSCLHWWIKRWYQSRMCSHTLQNKSNEATL